MRIVILTLWFVFFFKIKGSIFSVSGCINEYQCKNMSLPVCMTNGRCGCYTTEDCNGRGTCINEQCVNVTISSCSDTKPCSNILTSTCVDNLCVCNDTSCPAAASVCDPVTKSCKTCSNNNDCVSFLGTQCMNGMCIFSSNYQSLTSFKGNWTNKLYQIGDTVLYPNNNNELISWIYAIPGNNTPNNNNWISLVSTDMYYMGNWAKDTNYYYKQIVSFNGMWMCNATVCTNPKNDINFILMMASFTIPVYLDNIYVASYGNDTNDGTILFPFKTIEYATQIAHDTITLIQGNFNESINLLNITLIGQQNRIRQITGGSIINNIDINQTIITISVIYNDCNINYVNNTDFGDFTASFYNSYIQSLNITSSHVATINLFSYVGNLYVEGPNITINILSSYVPISYTFIGNVNLNIINSMNVSISYTSSESSMWLPYDSPSTVVDALNILSAPNTYPANTSAFYVSNDGDDNGFGSITNPFRTINAVIDKLQILNLLYPMIHVSAGLFEISRLVDDVSIIGQNTRINNLIINKNNIKLTNLIIINITLINAHNISIQNCQITNIVIGDVSVELFNNQIDNLMMTSGNCSISSGFLKNATIIANSSVSLTSDVYIDTLYTDNSTNPIYLSLLVSPNQYNYVNATIIPRIDAQLISYNGISLQNVISGIPRKIAYIESTSNILTGLLVTQYVAILNIQCIISLSASSTGSILPFIRYTSATGIVRNAMMSGLTSDVLCTTTSMRTTFPGECGWELLITSNGDDVNYAIEYTGSSLLTYYFVVSTV